MSQKMLLPPTWYGTSDQVPWNTFKWLRDLPSTYCALNLTWVDKHALPLGYQCYVVSFYYEHIDQEWLQEQCQRVQAPVILLTDWHYYNWKLADNLHCFTYYSLAQQAQQMLKWWPNKSPKEIKYKASAICNRITQSKMLVFTKLAETMGLDNIVTALGTWIEDKNVHYWQLTGNASLDQLMLTFQDRYLGKEIRFDDFNPANNTQNTNSNPWNPAYQNVALNFTNENFHYSYRQDHILPGPFVSEKTLKCLVGGTAFVAVAQFDTYRTLENLGFEFNYGFDLSWDQDSGDLTRLESIVKLIDVLNQYTAQELYEMTKSSTQHNQDHVYSGAFAQQCLLHNLSVQETVINQFG